MKRFDEQRCCAASHCKGDEYPIEAGKQTLFVNASISNSEGHLSQKPWVVDIELARSFEHPD